MTFGFAASSGGSSTIADRQGLSRPQFWFSATPTVRYPATAPHHPSPVATPRSFWPTVSLPEYEALKKEAEARVVSHRGAETARATLSVSGVRHHDLRRALPMRPDSIGRAPQSVDTTCVDPPSNVTPPTVSAALPFPGSGFTGTVGTWDNGSCPSITYSISWYRYSSDGSFVVVQGPRSLTQDAYVASSQDVSFQLALHVSATNNVGSTIREVRFPSCGVIVNRPTASTFRGYLFPGDCRPAGGDFKADTHIAVGGAYLAETTNAYWTVFDKGTGGTPSGGHRTLADFFGYYTKPLVDSRVVRDNITGRWIVTSLAQAQESPSVSKFFIAVSQPGAAVLGPYWVWSINANFSGTDCPDFPQLGQDSNSIVITMDVFSNSTGCDANTHGPYKYAEMFSLPKTQLYSGSFVRSGVFPNLARSLAPPIVLDSNPNTFFVSSAITGSSLTLYAGQNLGDPARASLGPPVAVPVPAYTLPPSAATCDPAHTNPKQVETLDSRFVNASTQFGHSLWQVHTITDTARGGHATPKFYEINLLTNSPSQQGFFYRNSTSDDWNASIASDLSYDGFVTWDSGTGGGSSSCANPQIWFGDRQATDPPGTITGTGSLFQSAAYYAVSQSQAEFWGDYSAVSLDPADYGCGTYRRAWVVNQSVVKKVGPASDTWGSWIGAMGIC